MKTELSFEKIINSLLLKSFFLALISLGLSVIMDLNNRPFLFVVFLTLAIFIVAFSLLRFSQLTLHYKIPLDSNKYYFFILMISFAVSISLFNKTNIMVLLLLVLLLSFYGKYGLNLNSKEGKENLAKRIAYLSLFVSILLFILAIMILYKHFKIF